MYELTFMNGVRYIIFFPTILERQNIDLFFQISIQTVFYLLLLFVHFYTPLRIWWSSVGHPRVCILLETCQICYRICYVDIFVIVSVLQTIFFHKHILHICTSKTFKRLLCICENSIQGSFKTIVLLTFYEIFDLLCY